LKPPFPKIKLFANSLLSTPKALDGARPFDLSSSLRPTRPQGICPLREAEDQRRRAHYTKRRTSLENAPEENTSPGTRSAHREADFTSSYRVRHSPIVDSLNRRAGRCASNHLTENCRTTSTWAPGTRHTLRTTFGISRSWIAPNNALTGIATGSVILLSATAIQVQRPNRTLRGPARLQQSHPLRPLRTELQDAARAAGP
jgi:hypothetical protein